MKSRVVSYSFMVKGSFLKKGRKNLHSQGLVFKKQFLLKVASQTQLNLGALGNSSLGRGT